MVLRIDSLKFENSLNRSRMRLMRIGKPIPKTDIDKAIQIAEIYCEIYKDDKTIDPESLERIRQAEYQWSAANLILNELRQIKKVSREKKRENNLTFLPDETKQKIFPIQPRKIDSPLLEPFCAGKIGE